MTSLIVTFATTKDARWTSPSPCPTTLEELRTLIESRANSLVDLSITWSQLHSLTPLLSDISLPALGRLVCFRTSLADASVLARCDLPLLTHLRLDGAKLATLPDLSSLPNLSDLSVSKNRLTSLESLKPLAGLGKLRSLTVSQNQLIDLTPLSGLTSLTELSLDKNAITNIQPLTTLTHLELLTYSENCVQDWAPLLSLPRLWFLCAYLNPSDEFFQSNEIDPYAFEGRGAAILHYLQLQRRHRLLVYLVLALDCSLTVLAAVRAARPLPSAEDIFWMQQDRIFRPQPLPS